MLRRMLALVALVSLMALAACNSTVTGVQNTEPNAKRASDRFQEELAPKVEIEEPGEGGGGGSGSDQRPTAQENQRRRGGEEIAPQ